MDTITWRRNSLAKSPAASAKETDCDWWCFITCLSVFSGVTVGGGLTRDVGVASAFGSLLSRRNARRKLLFLSANFLGWVTRHAPRTSLDACNMTQFSTINYGCDKVRIRIWQRSNFECFQQIRNSTNVLSALLSNVNSWKSLCSTT